MQTGDRIRLIRTNSPKKVTQTQFGARIGVSREVIASYELNRVEPPEPTIRLICREYGVAYAWLKDGEGDMFDEGGDAFDEVARQLNLNEFQRRMVQMIYEMPIEHQRIFRDYAVRLAKEDEQLIETEHERIERVANDYLEAYEAQQPPGEQTDKRA